MHVYATTAQRSTEHRQHAQAGKRPRTGLRHLADHDAADVVGNVAVQQSQAIDLCVLKREPTQGAARVAR
jgi:hypothetical protein